MDNILSRLGNADLMNLSQTSKTLARAVGHRSSNRASKLSGSMELLAAAEGNHEGVLPKDALARAEHLHPHYRGGPKELMRMWQGSRQADSYEDPSPASAIVGPGGVLGIRQGQQTQWLSPR
ncbi:F-box protein [Pseudomonas sp.]|uniref:F-box protein n=1 Tax=Pseudomonas sp. TaxID=306 RepID=UPI00342F4029